LSRTATSDVTVSGTDGVDSLSNVEYFVFDDQQVAIWDLTVM